MENIRFLILSIIIFGVSFVTAGERPHCQISIRGYEYCTSTDTLLSVRELKPNLEQKPLLYISNENITGIALGAFNNLSIQKLVLHVASKRLDLMSGSFSGLPMLESLTIFHGMISLERTLFQEIRNLKYLTLRIDGSMQPLERNLPKLENLKSLTIIDSNLGEINSHTFFNYYSSIVRLILARNSIRAIKMDTFKRLLHLEDLRFNSNGLGSSHFPIGVFNGLDNLRNFSILSDNLVSIYKDMFIGLDRLEKLNLTGNKIEYIQDKAFFGMNILQLVLNNNKLENVTSEIFDGLKKLEILYLANNRIKKIDDRTFSGLNLHTLNLMDNHLTKIGKETFDGLYTEKMLLSRNSIAQIEDYSFRNVRVKSLFIDQNNLTTLKKSMFHLLNHLDVLNLKQNQINIIEAGTFQEHSLSLLDLNLNPMKELQDGAFDGLTCKIFILSDRSVFNFKNNVFENITNSSFQITPEVDFDSEII